MSIEPEVRHRSIEGAAIAIDSLDNSRLFSVNRGTRVFTLEEANKPINGRFLSPCRPSGIVVSGADCCSVGSVFQSREGMDVCKCIVTSQHGGTLNSRRVASPIVRLGKGEER
ncbi:hypothetical protein TNCV_4637541 [Trichonephila clavipes]|nr:hypothetical protein TNCV_4637541 [Trichonephila clavipes]